MLKHAQVASFSVRPLGLNHWRVFCLPVLARTMMVLLGAWAQAW